MSRIERQCRLTIWMGYVCWAFGHGVRPINGVAYARALGLEITEGGAGI
jgi:hypothetical protein